MLKLEITTANDAFADDAGGECARILRQVADRLDRGESSGKVRDYNGNTVGLFELGDDRDDAGGRLLTDPDYAAREIERARREGYQR